MKRIPIEAHVAPRKEENMLMTPHRLFIAATLLAGLTGFASSATAQSMPVHDVTDVEYGATPDASGDNDAQAFRDAIEDADALEDGTLTVFVPPGTYDLERIDNGAAVFVTGAADVVIRGSGPASVIRMKEAVSVSGANHLFKVTDSARLRFENLTLDGNRSNIGSTDPESDLVHLEDSTDVTFSNVTFREGWGEGLEVISGSPASERVEVDRCLFSGFELNGVSVKDGSVDVRIHDSRFTGIDLIGIKMTPSTTGVSKIAVIDNAIGGTSHINYPAVDISGGSSATTNVIFTDNHVQGRVQSTLLSEAIFSNNQIDGGHSNSTALSLDSSIENVVVSNNLLTTTGSGIGLRFGAVSSAEPTKVSVASNIIRVSSGVGIDVEDAPTGLMVLYGNTLSASSASSGVAIRVRNAQAGTSEAFSIMGNIISNFLIGVSLQTQNSGVDLTGVNIVGNSFVARSSVSSVGTWCANGSGSTVPSPTMSANYWNATTQNDGC